MTKYTFKRKKGIDDLYGLYAFVGNSQGDTTITNSIEEYKASRGWLSFVFNCDLTDDAIAAEIHRRKEWNINYINNLHRQNKYGEEYEESIELVYNPELDDSHIVLPSMPPLTSYNVTFIDFSKDT